ncbi:hypothetical protein PGT21_003052 [Puccinia graminis f. sp. tritici]|uniref:Uncharacterized protein n=1 Tax=Puccinia graminis f. sp. tritici TaxID=56615 RepID=A0A5B0QM41_PUCGR|nr:hypothetical protein PGT21_003052 [Puccinia graminis f. sp. tritici]
MDLNAPDAIRRVFLIVVFQKKTGRTESSARAPKLPNHSGMPVPSGAVGLLMCRSTIHDDSPHLISSNIENHQQDFGWSGLKQ